MKQLFTILILVVIVSLFGGCATIFTGSSDQINIDSTPSGAQILVNGIERGTTPTTVSVKRNVFSTDITLRLDGYESRTFTLENEFNAVSVLNFFNILFWGIDAATGAMMRYRPQFYEINLQARPTSILNHNHDFVDFSDLNKDGDKYLITHSGNLVILDAIPGHVLTIHRIK